MCCVHLHRTSTFDVTMPKLFFSVYLDFSPRVLNEAHFESRSEHRKKHPFVLTDSV